MSKPSSKQTNETKSLPKMNLGVELPEFDKTQYPHGGYGKLRDFGWWVYKPTEGRILDEDCRLIRYENLPSVDSTSCAIDVERLEMIEGHEALSYYPSLDMEMIVFGEKDGELRFGIVTEEYSDVDFCLEEGLFAMGLSDSDYSQFGEDVDIIFGEIKKDYVQNQARSLLQQKDNLSNGFLDLAIFRPYATSVLSSHFVYEISGGTNISYVNLSLKEMTTVVRWIIQAALIAKNDNYQFEDDTERELYEKTVLSACSELGLKTLWDDVPYVMGLMLDSVNQEELLEVNPPQPLSDLCARILNPQDDEVVYNPFAALGGIAQTLPDNEVLGEEPDAFISFLSLGYQYAIENANAHYKSEVTYKDPIISLQNTACEHKYIASILPINFTDKERAEALNLMIDRLAPEGTLVCALPISFTTETPYKTIRRRLINGDFALDIISLPPLYEPYSSVGLCLLKVRRVKKEYQRQIIVVDGTGFMKRDRYSRRRLLIDSLVEAINAQTEVTIYLSHELLQDTILKPERYLTLLNLPKLPKNVEYYPLKQIVSVAASEKEKSNAIILCTNGSLLRYVKGQVSLEKMPKNSVAIKADERLITNDYLLHELQAEYVKRQFNALSSGSTVKRISRKDLLDILIAVPSIEEQRRITEAFFKSELNQANKELEMALARYKEDTHLKKHAIGQDLADLMAGWENLMFVRQRENGCLNDDMKYANMTVAEIEESIGCLIEVIRKQIDEFTIADDKKGNDKIKLFDFLNEYVKNHKSSRFEYDTIDCVKELRNAVVNFSKPALEHVIKNIIFNAKAHGFDGCNNNEPEKNRIHIWISVDDDKLMVTIANNGKPMNETIRKRMFEYSNSSAFGKDGHKGTGCYQAKQLMTENGGDIELLPADDMYPVIFKLSFNNFNINDYEK